MPSGTKDKLPLMIITAVVVSLLAMAIQNRYSMRQVIDIDLSETIDDSNLILMPLEQDKDVLLFSFGIRQNPEEEARQLLPLLKYLSDTTGLKFALHFTPKSHSIADDLGDGTIQFAAIGPFTYLQAEARYGVIPLVCGLNPDGQTGYQSMIIVAPDSPLQKVEDLRGKRFGVCTRISTRGHLIPRIVLAEHGLSLNDLASFEHTESHWDCATNLINGKVDACGVPDRLARQLAASDRVRILHSSANYPSRGIAANRDVPAHVLAKVKQALLNYPKTENPDMDLTEMSHGFSEANNDDYAKLRQWSLKFGLLSIPAKSATP